jgi:hypothetical protein
MDPAPVDGEGTPALVTGLTLSTTAGELEFGMLLVGEIGNIGAPRVRLPGDSADDSDDATVSSLACGCDDGETRGDIPRDEAVTCVMSSIIITSLVITRSKA